MDLYTGEMLQMLRLPNMVPTDFTEDLETWAQTGSQVAYLSI